MTAASDAGWRTREVTGHQEPNANATNRDKCPCAPRRQGTNRRLKSCVYRLPVQVLLFLLNIPCVLYESICNIFRRSGRRRKRNVRVAIDPAAEARTIFPENTDDITDSEMEEYRNKIIAVTNFHSFPLNNDIWLSIEQELTIICENGLSKRLALWLEYGSFKGTERVLSWLSSLVATAIVADQEEVSEMLLQRFPALIQIRVEREPYKGLTVLHLAIIKKQSKLVTAMLLHHSHSLEMRQIILCKVAVTNEAEDKYLYPYAELVLNLAVWIGDEDILKTLVDGGAEMIAQDSHGNNVMHSVVRLASVNQHLALRVFGCLLKLIAIWISKSSTCSFLRSLSPVAQSKHGTQLLFLAANSDGYTPLKLAAKLGHHKLVDKIINIDHVYRFDHFSCGDKCISLYEVSEMDPILSIEGTDAPTVLESITVNRNRNHLLFFEIPAIQKLLQIKTDAYIPFMVIATAMHSIFIVTFSVSSYYVLFPRLLTVQNRTITDDAIKTSQDSPSLRFTLHYLDYILLVVAVLILLYCSRTYWYIWMQLRRRNEIKLSECHYLLYILSLNYFFSFSVAALLYFVFKTCQSNWEVVFLSWAMSLGWLCIYNVSRFFRNTAYFFIMLERITRKDLLRFMLMTLVVTTCFSLSFMALLAVDYDLDQHGFTFSSVAWKLFEVSVGISSIEYPFENSTHNLYLAFIYLGFILYMPIMIMTLLIAAMTHTYSEMGEYAPLLCQGIQLTDAITLEATLPSLLQQRGVQCYQQRVTRVYDIDGRLQERCLYLLETEATVPEDRGTLA